jgi:hypothetical protein
MFFAYKRRQLDNLVLKKCYRLVCLITTVVELTTGEAVGKGSKIAHQFVRVVVTSFPPQTYTGESRNLCGFIIATRITPK